MATKTKTINAGPVGLKPKGAYNQLVPYTLLDTVLYNHDSWVCTAVDASGDPAEITGIAPDDATQGAANWTALTDGGRAAVAVGQQVQTDFLAWFGATATAGIRKTVSDWFDQVQAAWTTWFGADAGSGIRKTWSDWVTLAQSRWTTWFGADDTAGVQKQWKDLKEDAATATSAATTAAELCEAWNEHPPYIGDGTNGDLNYWYLYDTATEQYFKGPYAKGDDLDWNSMSQADKEALTQLVIERLVFATVAEAEAAAGELT